MFVFYARERGAGSVCFYVCVCVCEREREREREKGDPLAPTSHSPTKLGASDRILILTLGFFTLDSSLQRATSEMCISR